jgi:hypothetical protein
MSPCVGAPPPRSATTHVRKVFESVVMLWLCGWCGQIIAPVLGMFGIVFSGFLITRKNIDDWFIWLYYLSPFSWTVRSFTSVEYHSDTYDKVCTGDAVRSLSPPLSRMGTGL